MTPTKAPAIEDFLSLEVFEEIANEVPDSGRYINPSKLTEEIRVRFVRPGITGFEAWNDENKPVRWEHKPESLPANIKPDLKGNKVAKRFMAGLVYDYADDDFKILQITQRTLIDQLYKYVKDSDYGNPLSYDIKINKTGERMETKYTLVAAPPKPLNPSIEEALEKVHCDLYALFDGNDPWAE